MAVLLAGCEDTSQPSSPPAPTGYWVTVEGTVRYVDRDSQGLSYVCIETEQGQNFTVKLLDHTPPVWQGVHGVFAYESADKTSGTWKNFVVKQRLPETEKK